MTTPSNDELPPAPDATADPAGAAPRRSGTAQRLTTGAITRRALFGVGLITVGTGVVAYTADLFGARRFSRWYGRAVGNYARAYTHVHLSPAERLVRHFDYLTLDPEGVTRFVADFEEHFGAVTPRAVGVNRIFYTKYLMSTDFFLNGADESRVVRYVMLHDPYVSPCWNPFGMPDATA